MRIKFDKDSLAVALHDQNFTWPLIQMLGQKKPTNNFKFKNCLFSAKKSKKEKYAYSSCGIRFDSAGLLSFIITLLEML